MLSFASRSTNNEGFALVPSTYLVGGRTQRRQSRSSPCSLKLTNWWKTDKNEIISVMSRAKKHCEIIYYQDLI